MRRSKMPYARVLAPELIATARAQRWEPAEIVRALFVERVAGRSRCMLVDRRKAAGFPTRKTFDTWDESASSIPTPTQRALPTSVKPPAIRCGSAGSSPGKEPPR